MITVEQKKLITTLGGGSNTGTPNQTPRWGENIAMPLEKCDEFQKI
jgi:hypothetical protein